MRGRSSAAAMRNPACKARSITTSPEPLPPSRRAYTAESSRQCLGGRTFGKPTQGNSVSSLGRNNCPTKQPHRTAGCSDIRTSRNRHIVYTRRWPENGPSRVTSLQGPGQRPGLGGSSWPGLCSKQLASLFRRSLVSLLSQPLANGMCDHGRLSELCDVLFEVGSR